MRSHIIQTNFLNGVVAPEYRANTMSEDYYKSLQVGENVVITPTGAIKRRGGLETVIVEKNIAHREVPTGFARIEPFFVNETSKYILLFRNPNPTNGTIFVYTEDGVLEAEISLGAYGDFDFNDVDVTQAVETMVFTHPTIPPFELELNAGVWTSSPITLSNIPQYNFTTRQIDAVGGEDVWSVTRGYPMYCTFFQNRLWFAGSSSLPMSAWGSQLNDFFDFDISAGDTNALFENLEYQHINPITGIYGGRFLQVFTSGNEFINTSSFITQTDSVWKVQTNYGAASIKPVSIDGSVLFVDRSLKNIRQHVYKDAEQGFVALHTNRKSAHLAEGVVSMAVVKGSSSDVNDYLIAVNGDGTAAVMNSSRQDGISAWTEWNTQLGEFKDVMTLDDTIYFLVERFGVQFVERINNDLHVDQGKLVETLAPTTNNVAHYRVNVVAGIDNIVHTFGSEVPLSEYEFNYNDAVLNANNSDIERLRFLDLILDNSIQDRVNLEDLAGVGEFNYNKVTFPRTAYKAEIGINYPVKILTMPLNAQTQSGQGVNLRKRVIRVILHLLDSKAVILEDIATQNRQFPVPFGVAEPLFTGIKEVYLLGYGRLVEIEISQDLPFPMTVLSIDAEVEV